MGSEMKSIGTSLLLLLIPIFTLLFIYISIFNSSSNPFQITSDIIPRKNRHLLLLPQSKTISITHQQKQLLQLAKFHCSETLYKDLCITTLTSFPNLHNQPLNNVICASLNLTVHEVESSASNCTYTLGNMTTSTSTIQQKRALQDCIELLDDTIDELQSAVVDLESKKIKYADVQTLLSGAMTNQYTCLDGVGTANKTLRDTILQPKLTKISHHVSNALAMLKKTKLPKPNSSVFGESYVDGFPGWMSKKDRRLLETPLEEMKYDVVVAKDGSGNFTTVAEAVAAAPEKSETRFVIYIKKGAYLENVEVKKKVRNIMFVGDGIEKTVIKGYRNVVDGWTTFRSATLAVVGTGFIAKGISVENASGPNKHQAVALRSGSDLSAFYKCSFVGYQDTLYVHSLRQFYRECDIYGTVDFIFGNAAVVFQNSNLYARKPNENQKNIFTAQGRDDPNQNTGISIQNCKLTAAADLLGNKTAFPTYLGRPWRLYSRTVVMESYIDDVVKPAGWLEWSGDFALNTSYYGEYKNTGPGANTSGRVSWVGVHRGMNSTEAEQFTVGRFIEGSEWIPGYHIPASYQLTVA